jgi:hypothetical protein
MIHWNNLDALTSFGKLTALKKRVDLTEAMAGEGGAGRVKQGTVLRLICQSENRPPCIGRS